MQNTLSLVMIVKNEASKIRRCLDSVCSLVDEIIIVDTGSTDNTRSIAEEYKAQIYDFEWINDFSAARNFALSQATGNWSLVLDADEYISNDCRAAISDFIHGDPAIGLIKRVDAFSGNEGIDYEHTYISRLFPSFCRYEGKIHEQILSDLPRRAIDMSIFHDGYLNEIKSERNIPILLNVIAEYPGDPYYHYQIAKEYRGLDQQQECFEHLNLAYEFMQGNENYASSLIVNFLYAMIASGNLAKGVAVIEKQSERMQHYPDFYFASALYLLELILSDPDSYGNNLPLIEKFYLKALEIGESEQEGSVRGTGSFAAHHNMGVFYEVVGDIKQAQYHYERAAEYKYAPSIKRLEDILRK